MSHFSTFYQEKTFFFLSVVHLLYFTPFHCKSVPLCLLFSTNTCRLLTKTTVAEMTLMTLIMEQLLQSISPVSQPQTWMVRVPVELREGGPLSTTRIGRKYTFCSWRLKPDRWVRIPAVLSERHDKAEDNTSEQHFFICSLVSAWTR